MFTKSQNVWRVSLAKQDAAMVEARVMHFKSKLF